MGGIARSECNAVSLRRSADSSPKPIWGLGGCSGHRQVHRPSIGSEIIGFGRAWIIIFPTFPGWAMWR